jgi:plastocyanin
MRYRLALLALVLPVIGACSDSSDTSSSPASSPATSVSDAQSAAGDGAVGIANFKFAAATVNVPVGGSVEWTNNDAQQHTATSSGNFDAGAIQPGESATVEFPTAGSFTYICSFHPFMTGTVVVG